MKVGTTSLLTIVPGLTLALVAQACAYAEEVDDEALQLVAMRGSLTVPFGTVGNNALPTVLPSGQMPIGSQSGQGMQGLPSNQVPSQGVPGATGAAPQATMPGVNMMPMATGAATLGGGQTPPPNMSQTFGAPPPVPPQSTPQDPADTAMPEGTDGTPGMEEVTDDEAAPAEDPAPDVPQALLDATNVSVLYTARSTSAMGNISFTFFVKNNDAMNIDLSEITVRYWYTSDDTEFTRMDIINDYVHERISPISIELGANAAGFEYIEFGYSPLDVNVATQSGQTEIQVRIEMVDNEPYDQSNDWSFNPMMGTTAQENPRMTAYRRGGLVFGEEPE